VRARLGRLKNGKAPPVALAPRGARPGAAMQAFDELWWDHDQLVAWAETREREALEYAAFGVGGVRLPPSTQKIADWIRDTTSRRGARDINAELWAASKWPPQIEGRSTRAKSFEEALARPELPEAAALVAAYFGAEKNERFFLRLIFDGPILFENEQDIPSSHPTMAHLSLEMRELVRSYCARSEPRSSQGSRPLQKFPTAAFVLRLLREGRLTARGHLLGEPLARELSSDDWASLEIEAGGWHNKLCVWRTSPPVADRNGDIEKVLVRRAEVLKEFPPDPPPRKVSIQEVSDDDARHVIQEAFSRNGGFLSQKKGADIVRTKFPGFNKQRAMEFVKELTRNTKRGPRGPRQNCPEEILSRTIRQLGPR
jgi:hypothetical protein